MKVAEWLSRSIADAETRGLPQLRPMLEALARSTEALRSADAEFGHSAVERAEAAGSSDDDGR